MTTFYLFTNLIPYILYEQVPENLFYYEKSI